MLQTPRYANPTDATTFLVFSHHTGHNHFSSEAEQSTPPLSKRINQQRRQKQPHCDSNRDLDDRKANVQRNAINTAASANVRSADSRRAVDSVVPNDLVGRLQARDERALHRETGWDLYEYRRQHGCGRETVSDLTRVRDKVTD